VFAQFCGIPDKGIGALLVAELDVAGLVQGPKLRLHLLELLGHLHLHRVDLGIHEDDGSRNGCDDGDNDGGDLNHQSRRRLAVGFLAHYMKAISCQWMESVMWLG